MAVTAPFNEETTIATVMASWETQPAAAGASEENVHFVARVSNRLADRLYVRLDNFELTDASGAPVVSSPLRRGCIVAANADSVVLSGDLRLRRGSAARIAGFRVERFGVPLSERGRSIYREFLLQSEKFTAAQVDGEIQGYLNAESCS